MAGIISPLEGMARINTGEACARSGADTADAAKAAPAASTERRDRWERVIVRSSDGQRLSSQKATDSTMLIRMPVAIGA